VGQQPGLTLGQARLEEAHLEVGDDVDMTARDGVIITGRRRALVVSNTLFNEKTGSAIVCPLTNTHTGYPFHVEVTDNPWVRGFVMVEQVKSVDYCSRRARVIGRASAELLDDVLSIPDACLYDPPGNT